MEVLSVLADERMDDEEPFLSASTVGFFTLDLEGELTFLL